MKAPDTIIVDGRGYSWKRLCELRQQQLEAWRTARPAQPVLFELRDDHRPVAERRADGRYAEPTLMAWLDR